MVKQNKLKSPTYCIHLELKLLFPQICRLGQYQNQTEFQSVRVGKARAGAHICLSLCVCTHIFLKNKLVLLPVAWVSNPMYTHSKVIFK